MRIASLLPSATEIVCALGIGDQLVAVTHECDFPAAAKTKAQVTSSLLPEALPSALIDRAVRESRRDAHTIYALDAHRLTELAPDIVLTQSLCDVCAVPRSTVEAAVCAMPGEAEVLSLDPHSLDEMLDSILAVGERVGAPARAQRLVSGLRARIDAVREAAAAVPGQPRVFCCEWLDPIFRGGHWVPEQVRLAGGEDTLGREGEPSAPVAWEDVVRYAPEVLVLMPCGLNAAQAAARLDELASRPGWAELPVVRSRQVFAVDGSAYFSRPGPRLVDGLEILARVLHPGAFAKPAPPGAVLRLQDDGATFQPYR